MFFIVVQSTLCRLNNQATNVQAPYSWASLASLGFLTWSIGSCGFSVTSVLKPFGSPSPKRVPVPMRRR